MDKKAQQLIDALEQMAGRSMSTSADYEYLAQIIQARTRQYVSPTTLKRLGGYLSEPVKTRTSTLNILARALGYKDIVDFEQASAHGVADSNPAQGQCIESAKTPRGSIVNLAWQPDRKCTLRYLGNSEWEVTASQHTRLRPGQLLICHYIIDGAPLEVQLLGAPGNPESLSGSYICGRRYGITIIDMV